MGHRHVGIQGRLVLLEPESEKILQLQSIERTQGSTVTLKASPDDGVLVVIVSHFIDAEVRLPEDVLGDRNLGDAAKICRIPGDAVVSPSLRPIESKRARVRGGVEAFLMSDIR